MNLNTTVILSNFIVQPAFSVSPSMCLSTSPNSHKFNAQTLSFNKRTSHWNRYFYKCSARKLGGNEHLEWWNGHVTDIMFIDSIFGIFTFRFDESPRRKMHIQCDHCIEYINKCVCSWGWKLKKWFTGLTFLTLQHVVSYMNKDNHRFLSYGRELRCGYFLCRGVSVVLTGICTTAKRCGPGDGSWSGRWG